MTAFLVSRVRIRDPQKMQEYGSAAAPTVAAHGGEVLLRGSFAEALLGQEHPHAVGVMRFPDLSAIRAWFTSAEYQALTELREGAGQMEFVAYLARA